MRERARHSLYPIRRQGKGADRHFEETERHEGGNAIGCPQIDANYPRWTQGPLTSWAQLMAASGMAAVVYGTEAPAEDVHALLRHLRADAAALRLDVDRFGLFAASGNVTVGLSTLIRDRRLRCGALLHGCTMDVDGSTTVADMARKVRFVNACAGASVEDLPSDVPMLFLPAGRDQFPGLNAALDRVIERAPARNLPLSLLNHAAGAHGFDLDEHTAVSRGVVQQVLAFLRLQLSVND